jgi:hypothetical protein
MRFGLLRAARMTVGCSISRGMVARLHSRVKKICDTILDAIGETPLVRINSITPGHRQRDGCLAIGRDVQNSRQLDQGTHGGPSDSRTRARRLLKPGGTIIEGTSGNTGMGLAIAAVISRAIQVHLHDD